MIPRNTYRFLWVIPLLMLAVGCKSSSALTEGAVDKRMSARNIVRNHMSGAVDFRTLSGRLGIEYSDGESSQSMSVSFRMKRDEVIWMSALMGVVKVYITPDRVSFYNKLQNEFFDGDFRYLSDLLGSEIDFGKLQNLLLGQAVVDLREQKYDLTYTPEAYQLNPRSEVDLYRFLFLVEPKNFRMASQRLSQPEAKRLMEVRYSSYQQVQGAIIPYQVNIAAIEEDQRVTIGIDYKQVELNRELRFPYKIPRGYNSIAAQ